ncbi:MAG: hypothetical protein JNL90_19810 [Planctomycetes bacterium]|nr:hypothetical protein [Planctomycetota bacterium]
MRLLAALIATLCLASNALGQIFKIEFKDQKTAKKFKAFCIEINDEMFLVGEAKSGITLDEENNKLLYSPETNELWVADMDNPRACPYKLDKGQKVKAGGKATVAVNGADIKNISVFIRDQSLWGLTKEYGRRQDEIEDLKKQRDSLKKGTPEWKGKQTSLIQTMERLKSWLDSTIYGKASRKIKREIESEMKASKEANAQRLELAKQSIKLVPTPEDLARVGKETFGDAVVFKVAESQHIRIIYREECGDERVKSLLELGENLIEGFRVQFVDPYLSDDYKDYIPDGMFVEYCWAPDDVNQYEKFLNKYYGVTFEGPFREQRLKMSGHPFRRGTAPGYVDPSRVQDGSDLEGMVAHQMGHHLVNIHYNQDRSNDVADWLYEGVGNWLSLEYLGRNSVQCVQFDVGKYAAKSKGDNSEESALRQGTADIYHRLALEEGPTIDTLAMKKLAEFGDPDVAKSFSMFNFVAKSQGEKGQRWLRACCNAAAVPGGFIPQWRKKSEELYEVTGIDIFKKVNDEWVAFASELVGAPVRK